MAALDLAILLAPTEAEMADATGAIETARATLTRLEAGPLLARLEAALPAASQAAAPAVSDVRVGASAVGDRT